MSSEALTQGSLLPLAEALNQAGHETDVAHDGPAGLQLATRFKPDVALRDIGLPVMDGFELARQLRSHVDSQSMQLVAVTGYGQEHRTKAAGFDAHMVNPSISSSFPSSLCG